MICVVAAHPPYLLRTAFVDICGINVAVFGWVPL
jgi:hypothetical protein